MDELHSGNVSQNKVVGYREIWYVGEELIKGHEITEELFKQAENITRFFGITAGKSGYGPPIPVPSKDDQYLLEGTLISFHRPKQPPDVITTNIPKYLISLIAQEKKNIIDTAHKLYLPIPLELRLEETI